MSMFLSASAMGGPVFTGGFYHFIKSAGHSPYLLLRALKFCAISDAVRARL